MVRHHSKKANKLNQIEDCYYFLYSTCKRGSNCGFRHNYLSKQCKIICEKWSRTGDCREECPFRHSRYHLDKNRSEEQCWFEINGGCHKEFCEFNHSEPGKDDWKTGKIHNLEDIQKSKNSIHSEVVMDPNEFEQERRNINLKKKIELQTKKARRVMAENLKRAIESMDEKDKGEFQRVLQIIEKKDLTHLSNNTNNNKLLSDAISSSSLITNDYDDELKELDKLCN